MECCQIGPVVQPNLATPLWGPAGESPVCRVKEHELSGAAASSLGCAFLVMWPIEFTFDSVFIDVRR